MVRATAVVEVHDADPLLVAADNPEIDGYVTTHEALQAFLNTAGVSNERILVAPNAVDLPLYLDMHRCGRDALRGQLGLSPDQQVVCYSGRISTERNVEMLIDAARNLGGRAVVVLIGDGRSGELDRLRGLVAAQYGGADVRLIGHQSTLATAKFQIAADVLVLPYGRAGAPKYSPIKLAEYLAAGPPIVAFSGPIYDRLLSEADVVWAGEESASALAGAIARAVTRAPRNRQEIQRRLSGRCWADRARNVAAFVERLQGRKSRGRDR